jgi:hypothetical protein
MSPSSHWTLFIARPGNGRQHVIRDPQGEPRIIFGEDDGTRLNDRLARYIVESLNAGLNPTNPLVDDGWFVTGLEEGDEPDPAILICDLDFETRLEILETENREGIRRWAGRLWPCSISTSSRTRLHIQALPPSTLQRENSKPDPNVEPWSRWVPTSKALMSWHGSPISCQHKRSTKFGFPG